MALYTIKTNISAASSLYCQVKVQERNKFIFYALFSASTCSGVLSSDATASHFERYMVHTFTSIAISMKLQFVRIMLSHVTITSFRSILLSSSSLAYLFRVVLQRRPQLTAYSFAALVWQILLSSMCLGAFVVKRRGVPLPKSEASVNLY